MHVKSPPLENTPGESSVKPDLTLDIALHCMGCWPG